MFRSINAFFLWLHRWTGIVFALVFIMVGVSGTLLTFRFEIQQALHEELRLESAAIEEGPDFMAVARGLSAEIPGAEARFLQQNPAQPDFPIRVVYQHPEEGFGVTYAHPRTGELIEGDIGEPFWRFMRDLHIFLVQGMPGLFVVFASGWVLMLCSALGLWLWVPRLLKKPRVALGVRWRSGLKKLLLDLHNTTGVYLLVPMMLLALTGVTLILERLAPSDLPAPGPEMAAAAPAPPRDAPAYPALEAALQSVEGTHPGAFIRQVQLPRDDAPWFGIDLSEKGTGPHTVYLSASGETRIAGYAERDLALWTQLKGEFGVAIHEGYVLGDPGRWIVFICGITLTAGSVTGVWLWLIARPRRVRARLRPKMARRPSSAPVLSHHPAE